MELIGVDTLAGEDQVDDIIALDPPFWDGIVRVVRGGWSGDVVELGPAPWLILDPSLLSTLLVQAGKYPWNWTPSGGTYSYKLRAAIGANREYWPWKVTVTVSVGPLRCLARIRSASPLRGDSGSYSSSR